MSFYTSFFIENLFTVNEHLKTWIYKSEVKPDLFISDCVFRESCRRRMQQLEEKGELDWRSFECMSEGVGQKICSGTWKERLKIKQRRATEQKEWLP